MKILFLIAVIFLSACIETDIYLPAFPDMIRFFGVSEGDIQQILTWNFFGLCLSGPFYGPLSDAIGRKKPLICALGLFFLGSVITVISDSFSSMLCGRLLQGIGSGGCFTLGSAIIFDAFEEKAALKALNHLNVLIPVVMAAAPLLGGYLNYTYGFKSNFIAIAISVSVSFLICLCFFEETLPREKRVLFQPRKVWADFKCILTHKPFWQLTSAVSLLYGGYLVFLSYTAVLFVIDFGLSQKIAPFLQSSLLISYVLASLTCNRALEKFNVTWVKKTGMKCIAVGGLGFLGVAWLWPRNPYIMTVAVLPYSFGVAWVQTPYFGEIMQFFPDIKGSVSSLLTSIRLLMTVSVVGIASHFYNHQIQPLQLTFLGICTVVLSCVIVYERNRKRQAPGVLSEYSAHL